MNTQTLTHAKPMTANQKTAERMIGGEIVFRRLLGALSRHDDDCAKTKARRDPMRIAKREFANWKLECEQTEARPDTEQVMKFLEWIAMFVCGAGATAFIHFCQQWGG